MNRVMQIIIVIIAVIFMIASSPKFGSAGPEAKSQTYEYKGIIKGMSEGTHEGPHIVTIQTQTGLLNFHYQRHGRQECTGFRELAVGDSVKVTASENRKVSEATCIIKIAPVKTSR